MMMTTATVSFALVVGVTFLAGGIVKGTLGFGLPLVAVAALTPVYGLKSALALLIIPSFASNLTQAFVGRHLRALLRRLWAYLLAICIGMVAGVGVLSSADPRAMSGTLGVMLSLYALAALLRWELPSPGRLEPVATPLVGLLNGTLSGMTGVYVFPAALYLRALGLERDALIQAMGLVFLVSTLALAANLAGRNLLPGDLALASAGAVLPSLAGQAIGQRLRRRLSDQHFRRAFLGGLLVVGVGILLRAIIG